MLRKVLDSIPDECQKELILLKDLKISPCANCKGCHKTFKCVVNDDMQEVHQKLIDADVILLGSPTYFDNVSGIMKNFMDRCLPFYFSAKLKGKKTGLVSVGGFKELVEKDENGECIWCKEKDNACEKTVQRCLDSMQYFCILIGLEVQGSVLAAHGNPEEKAKMLVALGKKMSKE